MARRQRRGMETATFGKYCLLERSLSQTPFLSVVCRFKIYQEEATISASAISWKSQGLKQTSVTIPKSLPSGEYLLRTEHVALHSAGSSGGAQLYISCAQLKVTGGGSGSPSPLVAFPGAYKASDPGLLINIYYPIPKSYTPPGPAVWSG